MISIDSLEIDLLGLSFLVIFFLLIIVFAFLGRKRLAPNLREIPAFQKLGRAIGLAVDEGVRPALEELECWVSQAGDQTPR